jgi:hypothetical protein
VRLRVKHEGNAPLPTPLAVRARARVVDCFVGHFRSFANLNPPAGERGEICLVVGGAVVGWREIQDVGGMWA